MVENLVFDLEVVFKEVLKRRQLEGALTKEEYLDLVEEVLEEHREEGLLEDDGEFKQAYESLESRWPEVEEEAREGKDDDLEQE